MEKCINYLILHKPTFDQCIKLIGSRVLLWNNTQVTTSKISEDEYRVSYALTDYKSQVRIERSFLVNVTQGITPVDEYENNFIEKREVHYVFQDASPCPYTNKGVKWFMFELEGLVKRNKVFEGTELLVEMFRKIRKNALIPLCYQKGVKQHPLASSFINTINMTICKNKDT